MPTRQGILVFVVCISVAAVAINRLRMELAPLLVVGFVGDSTIPGLGVPMKQSPPRGRVASAEEHRLATTCTLFTDEPNRTLIEVSESFKVNILQ